MLSFYTVLLNLMLLYTLRRGGDPDPQAPSTSPRAGPAAARGAPLHVGSRPHPVRIHDLDDLLSEAPGCDPCH